MEAFPAFFPLTGARVVIAAAVANALLALNGTPTSSLPFVKA